MVKSTDNAVSIAVQNATVVKKPKTFWALTKVECILTRPAGESKVVLLRRYIGGPYKLRCILH